MMRQKPGQDDNIDDLDADNEEDDDLAVEEDDDLADEEDDGGNCRREAEKFSAQLKSFLRYEKSV